MSYDYMYITLHTSRVVHLKVQTKKCYYYVKYGHTRCTDYIKSQEISQKEKKCVYPVHSKKSGSHFVVVLYQ